MSNSLATLTNEVAMLSTSVEKTSSSHGSSASRLFVDDLEVHRMAIEKSRGMLVCCTESDSPEKGGPSGIDVDNRSFKAGIENAGAASAFWAS